MIKKILRKGKRVVKRILNIKTEQPVTEDTSGVIQRIGPNTKISNSELGNPVTIGENCFLYKVSVGDYTYLSMNVSTMNTKIGKFCSIGQGVCISIGRHPSHTFVSSSPVFFSPFKQCGVTFSDSTYFNEMGNTTIGNDVWIGANAVIMDDITIGDGAIIGAGSIITKDVPPYAIVVGMPGKVLKYRFTEGEIKFLTEFKWWDRDNEWIKENFKDFHNVKVFMNKYGNGNS